MAAQYVNLTPYDAQLAAIQRQQKYAELLAQQGAEPIDVQSVNGIPTPISPFQGLAKVFQQGMGGYLEGKATKDQAALEASDNAALIDALKNRSTTADVSTEGTKATLPGTTSNGVSTGPYSLDLAPVTVSGYQRSPSELASYDLNKAGSSAMSKPNRDMFLKSYTADQADVDALKKVTPQVNSMLADPKTDPAVKQILTDALAAGDTARINKMLGTIDVNAVPKAPTAQELSDNRDFAAAKLLKPGLTRQQWNADNAGLVAAAQGQGGLVSKEALARFTNNLPARPTASDTAHTADVTAWLAKPENKGKNSTDYDIWLSGQKTGAGAAATLAATDAFTAGIKTDNPIVVNAANSLASGVTKNITAVSGPYRSAVQERMNNAGVDAWPPALRGQIIRNAAALIKPYTSLPSYQSMAGSLTTIARMNAAMKKGNTVASSLELVDAAVGLAKGGTNSARTVTEAQVSFITSGQSPAQWFSQLRQQVLGGAKLSDEQRQQIYTVAKSTAGEYKKTYGDIYGQITDKLTENNIPKAFWPLPDLDKLASPVGKNGVVPKSAGMTQDEYNTLTPDELRHVPK
jgi:hypothetical protein